MFAWMRQAKDKVEAFKANQSPKHALFSKFNLNTGLPLEGQDDYGHLQIDVVSLYLLILVQMISSGLQIIYTMDEVTFVQNLVYYVERSYRTPDFGMWERGSKYNNGTPEVIILEFSMKTISRLTHFECGQNKTDSCQLNRYGEIGVGSNQRMQPVWRQRSQLECDLRRYRCSFSQSKHFRDTFATRIKFEEYRRQPVDHNKLAMFCHSRRDSLCEHQSKDVEEVARQLRHQTIFA